MAEQATTAVVVSSLRDEDALMHLHKSQTEQFQRHQVIYDQGTPAGEPRVYLIVSGMVAIQSQVADGQIIYYHLRTADDLIGYEALNGEKRENSALCLTPVVAMSWPVSGVAQDSLRQPKLGAGLFVAQTVHQLEAEVHMRIAATMRIDQRLAAKLAIIAGKVGLQEVDGGIRIPAITHEDLSRFVWTSREIITQKMNMFRRLGWIRYSRKGIIVYGTDQLVQFSLGELSLPAR